MQLKIRPYHSSDLTALYRICLLTGDNGKDASALYQDPDLLGHYYAAPYAVLEPDLCFVLTRDGVPSGYILGTRDSTMFAALCESEWFPCLRERYPLPEPDDNSHDAQIIRMIHQGRHCYDDVAAYPAHLHIDLLPIAQGQGMGRQLMQVFIGKLQELKVPGVHLGVGIANQGAIKFYERIGFHRVKELGKGIVFGMKFTDSE
jgi:ribosomal protein S18 acetylase RimI-like enzyme